MRLHISLCALAVPLLFAAPAARGQANQPLPAPTVRTSTSLVLVDVVVTDHGKPVLNLARNRFHVFEDGKEQTISSFDEHQPPAAPPEFLAPRALPPNTYTNVPTYPESSAVNVLLLDGLNTSIGNQMQVRHKMIEYLGSVKPGTTLAIFTLGTQLHIVTQFTNDPASLLALFKNPKTNPQQSAALNTGQVTEQVNNEISAVTPQPTAASASAGLANNNGISSGPMNAAMALQRFETDRTAFQFDMRMQLTLAAMQQLASYLGGIPGRKNVIWFSGSFPRTLLPQSSLGTTEFAALRQYGEQIKETDDMLAAARIAIYPVDARGLWVNAGIDASTSFAAPGESQSSQWASQRETQYGEEDTMHQIADDTGGEAFVETNDFAGAVAAAVDNGASYYTLAYVPTNGAYNGQYRKIEVKLDDGHGLKLAYRRGYYADAPGSVPSGADQPTSVFAAALSHDSPGATGILFKARVLPATDPAFRSVSLPGAAATKPADFKGPAHRYIVDLTLDPRGLAFDIAPDGTRKAAIELAMIAYNDNGQRLNYWTHAFQLGLNPAQLQRIMDTGISVRLPFDLPAGNVDLRIGVHDMNADRAGSLEVPLDVGKS